MKSTLLSRLRRTGLFCIGSAFLLVLVIPLLQLFLLAPQGYGSTTSSSNTNLSWIHIHAGLFLLYRVLLFAGFALALGFPFALFRIIVAQEILELPLEDGEESSNTPDSSGEEQEPGNDEKIAEEGERESAGDALPPFAWRGRGFTVLAAWLGFLGLLFIVAGTFSSTLYFLSIAGSNTHTSEAGLSGLFAILTYTIGSGCLGLSCLFFGAVIARRGRNLWPDSWVAFAYTALAVAALLCASAVEVALAPTAGQALLTTPAILGFSLWILWFGIMLIRLKPE